MYYLCQKDHQKSQLLIFFMVANYIQKSNFNIHKSIILLKIVNDEKSS